jgi:serine/threonine-protein kinase
MPDEPRVQELLAELLDRQATPEEVCGACLELLPVVRARWRQICRVRAKLDALLPIWPHGSLPTTKLEELPLPQVPGYEVETVLGRGGMGVVYRARHLRLGRLVALKMALAGSYTGSNERERFRREAEAVAALRHPNVVQVYDVGDADGRPYFTMELMEGGSLARKLAGAPQPPRQTAELLATLAGSVQSAHEAGVVHRDLKPGNVLLTADGTPKVADFGLARRLDADERLTLSGAVIGTPSYTAPEQARGDRGAVGPRTDVYALGAILYECLTGRPPFDAGTAAATLQQVVADEPAAPRRLNPSVPRDLETVCLKCLQKEPRQRYASAAELADDLHRFERGEPIAARRVGVIGSLRKWAHQRPATAALLAAVALVAAAGAVGAWQLSQQRADARARQARTDQEVHAILGLARVRLGDAWKAADLEKLAEAKAEGNRAADIARSGGASAAVQQEAEVFQEDATGRLERAERNRALLEALQDVSVHNETLAYVYGRTNSSVGLALPSADELYGTAFRRWGLDVDGTAEDEVVQRLGAEPAPVAQELVAGLDGWMLERRRNRPEAEWRRLYRVAERLDGSDLRRRMRALMVGGAPPRAEVVAGLVGIGSPWPAPWALAHGGTWQALLELRREIDPRTEAVLTVALLAGAFVEVGDAAEAERVLRQAVTARPKEVVLLVALGRLLERQGPSRLTEAIGYYRAARSRRPLLGIALGRVLLAAGKADEAEEVLQQLARQPAHDHDPALFLNLGATLFSRRKYIEAEAASRKATDLRPDLAEAHGNLGSILLAQRQYGEAEAAIRKALDLKPDLAEVHNSLGNALMVRRRCGEAEAAFRKAIELKPDFAAAYYNLGNALMGQSSHREAEVVFRKALDLKPDFAEAYTNLGSALVGQGRHMEAETALRKALSLNPGLNEAHLNLGIALMQQARFDEASAALEKARDLLPAVCLRRIQVWWLQYQCQRYAVLDAKLPAVLRGTEKPTNAAEQIVFARLCTLKKHYAAAARLYVDVFAAIPRLAEASRTGFRYDAARAAALAGGGQGKDAADLDDADRARWRLQALEWLRLDLAWWGKALDGGRGQARAQVRARMQHWRSDSDFAGVRGNDALARIPAEEREQWERLWAEVDALLRRASEPD